MANDNFYGYSNKKPEFILPNGNIDMAFEKVNPYEFRKGMDYELTKMGCRNLHSSTPEQREKATTIVLKNLNEMGGYYSGLISYETEYRGRDKKPSFKKYMEGMADHGMKEVTKEFKKDKMEKIKLKESIDKLIKEELESIKNENYGSELSKWEQKAQKLSKDELGVVHVNFLHDNDEKWELSDWFDSDYTVASYEDGIKINENKMTRKYSNLKIKEARNSQGNFASALEKIIQKAWGETDLEKAKNIVINFVKKSKINDTSKDSIIKNTQESKSKAKLDSYLANALLKFEKLGVKEQKIKENKMTKKELDQMIMEELESYLREEEEIEVDVEDDAEDGNSEDVLRKIYDMLKDMFEGGEEMEDEGEEEEMEDEMEDEEEEMEDEMEDEEEEEEVEESIQLQERFQKLANIVKG
jgi:hypothetical protein